MLYYLRRNSLDVACILSILTVFLFSAAVSSAILWAIGSTLGCALIFVLLSCFRFGRRLVAYRRTVLVGAVLMLLALGACYYISYRNEPIKHLSNTNETHIITGYATSTPKEGNFGKSTVTVTEMDGEKCHFRLSLLRTNQPSPEPYLEFSAQIVFDLSEQDSLEKHADNIAGEASVLSLTVFDRKIKTPCAFFFRVGSKLQKKLQKNLSPDAANLASALLLGRRDGLSDPLKRDFRTLGISHLLAVSGMHLSILSAALLFLLAKLRVKRGIRFVVCSTFILFYCGICGFAPSILRAALMSITLLCANLAGEKISAQRSLLLSLAVILMISPYLIFDISLQLSIMATLGILILFPFFTKKETELTKKPLRSALWKLVFLPFSLTLSAVIFTFPVLYFRFGSISLISPIANLLFVPIITLLMYLLPLFLLFSFVPYLALPLAPIVEFLCLCVNRLSGTAKYVHDLYCHIPPILPLIILLCLGGAYVLFRYKIKYGGILSALALCAALFLAYPFSVYNDTRLLYQYNGERESILMRSGNTVLFAETGNASRSNAYTALHEAAEQLQQNDIDQLLLTHYHAAGASLVRYLLDNTYLECVYLPTPKVDTDWEYAQRIRHLCQEQSVKVVLYKEDTLFSAGEFDLSVHTEQLSRSTHPAQAIALRCGNSRVLFADPAVFELDGLGSIDLSAVDHLIFLNSPPIDKYPLPDFKGAEGVHAVYTEKAQFDIIGCPFSNYTVLTSDEVRIFIRFGD